MPKAPLPSWNHVLIFFVGCALQEPGALDRHQLGTDTDFAEIVHHGLGDIGVGAVAVVFAGVEAAGITGFGKQLFSHCRIVNGGGGLPVIVEALRDDAAGQLGVAEGQRLVDAFAVDRQAGRFADPLVVPRRFRVPLVGKGQPERGRRIDRLQGQPGAMSHFFREFAADRIGDVDLAALQRGQPGRLVRDHLHHDPLDGRVLAPIALERLQHQLDAGVERDELVGAGADRVLLVAVVADLLDVLLGDDPARPGGAAVKGQKVRPRLLELEPHMPWIGGFDLGHPARH